MFVINMCVMINMCVIVHVHVGTTQNQLMLSVLRHSPMKLIGRLVFEKSIVPQT